jgi:tRNA uridine 5-carbamoylmethylation protein Kti12
MQIKKLNIEMIQDYDCIIIIGSRGSGKSILIKDILYNKKSNISTGIIISPTEKIYGTYSNINLLYKIYDEYTPNIISNFLEEQKKNSVLVFDDCTYYKSFYQNLNELFIKNTSYKMMTILTEQYPVKYDSLFKNNINYVFIFTPLHN